MVTKTRMSPWTAMVLGVAGVIAVAITSGSAVVIYGLDVVGGNAESLVRFAESTAGNLPELIESLPPVLGDILNDQRAPQYVRAVQVDVRFVGNSDGTRYRPVLTVKNEGDRVVSLLAVRVAALSETGVLLGEWTEVVATPISLDDNDWRGPLMPGATRHVMVGGWRGLGPQGLATIASAVEISDIRVWRGDHAGLTSDTLAAASGE